MKKAAIHDLFNSLASMIKGGILYIFTGNLLTKMISMISSVIIARIVDKTEYAQLAYADNIYGYLALASGIGLSTAILNFVPNARDREERQSYLMFSLKTGGFFNLVMTIIVCIGAAIIDIPFQGAKFYIYIMMFYPLMTHLVNCLQCYLRALTKNKEYALVGVIQALVVCVCSIVFGHLLGVNGIVAARYTALFVVILFAVSIVNKTEGIDTYKRLSKDKEKEMCTLGISLMLANFFSGMMPLNESFLINQVIRNERMTANFKVAGLIPTQLYLISDALAVYFFPKIVQIKGKSKIKKTICRIGILNFVLISICMVIGMLITPYMIRLLYGEKYCDAVPISYMLWLIRGLNAGIRIIPLNFLPAVGGSKFNARIAAISVIIQLIMDVYFLNRYGIYGIIIGAFIVYILSAAAYWLYLFHLCKE